MPDRAHEVAYAWSVILPYPFLGRLLLFLVLFAAYLTYTLLQVYLPGLHNIVLKTETSSIFDNSSQVSFPTVYIATPNILNDQSSAVFSTSTKPKCVQRNFQTQEYGYCNTSMIDVKQSGYDVVVYNMSRAYNVTEDRMGDFLQLQVFYTFNASVTQGWYNTAYPPTVFLALSSDPYTTDLDTALNGPMWKNSLPISAGSINYVTIRKSEYFSINNTRTSGPYDISISAVSPSGAMNNCSLGSGAVCVLNIAVQFGDPVSSRYTETYQYDRKTVIIAAIGLYATPWSIAGTIGAIYTWRRQRRWRKLIQIEDDVVANNVGLRKFRYSGMSSRLAG